MVVDLPAPFWPTKPTISPSFTVKTHGVERKAVVVLGDAARLDERSSGGLFGQHRESFRRMGWLGTCSN